MTRDQAIELLRAKADKERQAATSRRDSAWAMDGMTLADAKDAAAMATRMTGRKHTGGAPREWKESARIDRACAVKCEQLAAAIDLAVDALLTAPAPEGEDEKALSRSDQPQPGSGDADPRGDDRGNSLLIRVRDNNITDRLVLVQERIIDAGSEAHFPSGSTRCNSVQQGYVGAAIEALNWVREEVSRVLSLSKGHELGTGLT